MEEVREERRGKITENVDSLQSDMRMREMSGDIGGEIDDAGQAGKKAGEGGAVTQVKYWVSVTEGREGEE